MPPAPSEAREIAVTLLGRFAVTVGGLPVPEASWKRRHSAALAQPQTRAASPGRALRPARLASSVPLSLTSAHSLATMHIGGYGVAEQCWSHHGARPRALRAREVYLAIYACAQPPMTSARKFTTC
jgi:hypothetical protein